MERITLLLNNPVAFDHLVHGGGIPECRDLTIATKARATKSGNAGVVIGFSVQLPGGTIAQVQAVTTVANFLAAAVAIQAAHPST